MSHVKEFGDKMWQFKCENCTAWTIFDAMDLDPNLQVSCGKCQTKTRVGSNIPKTWKKKHAPWFCRSTASSND